MNNFYKELADYIEEEDDDLGILTTGILPATPDDCTAILGQLSSNIGPQRDVPPLMFPRFQVLIRHKNFDNAEDIMYRIRTVLHGIIGLELPSFRVLRIHADQEGGPIGQDDQGRFEFSINFTAEIHELE